MADKDLEKTKKEEYMSMVYPELEIPSILEKKQRRPVTKLGAPSLEIPSIDNYSDEEDPLLDTGETLPDIPEDPSTAVENAPVPSPTKGDDMSLSAPSKNKLDEKDKDDMVDSLRDLQEELTNLKSKLELSTIKDEILEEVKERYKDLENELNSLKRREMPEREFFDTEGAYRDRLYSMATNMLDGFLPELFEEIPEYDFTATHVSRLFEDGTVADALITLMAKVPRDGMRYDFKVEVPVLNGLMQYPLYIQRGQKIIPLTKAEIQRELHSISYKKLDVDQPYKKDNIFNNIGENPKRRPDNQKWYEVAPNIYNQVAVPPDHIQQVQRGKNN